MCGQRRRNPDSSSQLKRRPRSAPSQPSLPAWSPLALRHRNLPGHPLPDTISSLPGHPLPDTIASLPSQARPYRRTSSRTTILFPSHSAGSVFEIASNTAWARLRAEATRGHGWGRAKQQGYPATQRGPGEVGAALRRGANLPQSMRRLMPGHAPGHANADFGRLLAGKLDGPALPHGRTRGVHAREAQSRGGIRGRGDRDDICDLARVHGDQRRILGETVTMAQDNHTVGAIDAKHDAVDLLHEDGEETREVGKVGRAGEREREEGGRDSEREPPGNGPRGRIAESIAPSLRSCVDRRAGAKFECKCPRARSTHRASAELKHHRAPELQRRLRRCHVAGRGAVSAPPRERRRIRFGGTRASAHANRTQRQARPDQAPHGAPPGRSARGTCPRALPGRSTGRPRRSSRAGSDPARRIAKDAKGGGGGEATNAKRRSDAQHAHAWRLNAPR